MRNSVFNLWVEEFLASYSSNEEDFFFEIDGDADRVQAVSIKFELAISNAEMLDGSDKIKKAKKEFDDFVDYINEDPNSVAAGLEAWHASILWTQAEATGLVLNSTIVSITVGLLCGVVVLFAVTWSLRSAFFVFILVLDIVVFVCLIMIAALNWPFGPVEALFLIIFLGYCVTYCIHIGHAYMEIEMEAWRGDRELRLRLTLL